MIAMAEPKKFRAEDAEIAGAQRNFDFLMPYKKALLTVPEVGKVIGREQDFVRELIDNGRLEAHADSAFGERKSNRVTRRSVLIYFARTAQYSPSHFIDTFEEILRSLTTAQLSQLIITASRLRAERPLNAA